MDKNSALYWLPKVEATGLPTPRTIAVPINGATFFSLVDGEPPKDLPLAELDAAARTFGYPVFVRSDITSAKHVLPGAARVTHADEFLHALYCIAEQHGMAMGMPDPRAILSIGSMAALTSAGRAGALTECSNAPGSSGLHQNSHPSPAA